MVGRSVRRSPLRRDGAIWTSIGYALELMAVGEGRGGGGGAGNGSGAPASGAHGSIAPGSGVPGSGAPGSGASGSIAPGSGVPSGRTKSGSAFARLSAFDIFLGDPTLSAEARGNFVKGNIVRARARYVLRHFGEVAVADVAARLTAPVREVFLNPPLVSDWVPFSTMIEMDQQILEGPMRNDLTHVQKLGEEIALFDMPTIYSAFLKRLSTPSFLMNRMHLLYKLYIRDGMAEGRSERPGQAVVTILNQVLPYYFCNWAMTGWLAGAIGLYQAQNIHVEHSACRHKGASVCQWDIRWD